MGNIDDGRALALHPREHRKKPGDFALLQRRGRLVENEDAAAPAQPLGDGHELTFRKTERGDRCARIRREVELGEHLARLLVHARAIDQRERAEAPHRKVAERDIFRNGEGRHEPQLLRDGHDARGDGIARARKMAFLPVDAHDAAVGTVNAAQDPDQGSLARAVLPDDGVDFAPRHGEVDAVKRDCGAKAFAHALGVHRRTSHRESIRCHIAARRRRRSVYLGTNATCIFGSVSLPRSMMTSLSSAIVQSRIGTS